VPVRKPFLSVDRRQKMEEERIPNKMIKNKKYRLYIKK
jgi:hypothetical protein